MNKLLDFLSEVTSPKVGSSNIVRRVLHGSNFYRECLAYSQAIRFARLSEPSLVPVISFVFIKVNVWNPEFKLG